MTDRKAASNLSTSNTPLLPADVSDQLRSLRANPIAGGSLLKGQKTDGTTNVCFLPHGLRRPFLGTAGAGQDRTSDPIVYLTPDAVIGLGKDPARFYAVRSPTAHVITFSVWVY